MKKALFGLLVLTLIFATSCKKSSTSSNAWTFKGTTYSVYTSTNTAGAITYSSINPAGELTCTFSATSPVAGSYSIVSSNSFPTATQVNFTFTNGTVSYGSTGSGNQMATVTVSSAGKVSVVLPNAPMGGGAIGGGGAQDTSAISGTVTQP